MMGGGFLLVKDLLIFFWYILVYFLVSDSVCKIDGTLEG